MPSCWAGTARCCPPGWPSTTRIRSPWSDGEGRRVDAEGVTLPRLLRRHPHHDDRLQRARGRPGGAGPGREDGSHLDPLPDRAPGRARREDRRTCRASPTPRSSSPTRAPRPTTPLSCSPPSTATPIRSWPCGAAITASRTQPSPSPASAPGRLPRSRPSMSTYVHSGYKLRSPFGHLSDQEFTTACVADLENLLEVATSGDVGSDDRRAHPGRGRVRHPA